MFELCFYVGVLGIGWFLLHLNPGQMRTLTLVLLVFAGQATVYVLREQGHLWGSRPVAIMLFASIAVLAVVAALAIGGVLMTPRRQFWARCWPPPLLTAWHWILSKWRS